MRIHALIDAGSHIVVTIAVFDITSLTDWISVGRAPEISVQQPVIMTQFVRGFLKKESAVEQISFAADTG